MQKLPLLKLEAGVFAFELLFEFVSKETHGLMFRLLIRTVFKTLLESPTMLTR